jgi:membrane protein YdbS with pleckstrin-like domain
MPRKSNLEEWWQFAALLFVLALIGVAYYGPVFWQWIIRNITNFIIALAAVVIFGVVLYLFLRNGRSSYPYS